MNLHDPIWQCSIPVMEAEMIVTIIGDSLALNRYDDGINDQDLYAYKIFTKFNGALYINNKAKRANTTAAQNTAENIKEDILANRSDFYIIQLGICDSSPRLFRERERKILSVMTSLKLTRYIASRYIKSKNARRYELTKRNPIRLVEVDDYCRNFEEIINAVLTGNPSARIYVITIAYPGEYLTSRSYGIIESIEAYNACLHALADTYVQNLKIIDLFAKTKESGDFIVGKDGHHITPEAHDWIADEISGDISCYVAPKTATRK